MASRTAKSLGRIRCFLTPREWFSLGTEHLLLLLRISSQWTRQIVEPSWQPRSQGLSSLGRKTLVQAGHVPPKKWEVTKKLREGEVTESRFCLSLTHYGKGKFVQNYNTS